MLIKYYSTKFFLFALISLSSANIFAQDVANLEKAEAVIAKTVAKLGGNNYLQVKTQFSAGLFTLIKDGIADIPSNFIDVISYPDKERTEFKQLGNKTIQTNYGNTGWIFDGATRIIREQDEREIAGFKKNMRTSPDNLLRGSWKAENAVLSYVGRREAGIGKRNEVLKLTYADGFWVEFEFAATDGLPMKTKYSGKDVDEVETKEEDRFAQFIEIQGVLVPFIVDHFIDGKQFSRINYEKIELNRNVPDSVFAKPRDPKELKKDLKF